MGRDGQANAPQEVVVLLLCQRDELLVLRPRIIPMAPAAPSAPVLKLAPWSWTDVRGTAPQFCGPKFIDTEAMAVPIAGVRFGHSTTRSLGRVLARGSRGGWRLR